MIFLRLWIFWVALYNLSSSNNNPLPCLDYQYPAIATVSSTNRIFKFTCNNKHDHQESCVVDSECLSAKCYMNECLDITSDRSCGYDNPCPDTHFCQRWRYKGRSMAKCRRKYFPNTLCYGHHECISGRCGIFYCY